MSNGQIPSVDAVYRTLRYHTPCAVSGCRERATQGITVYRPATDRYATGYYCTAHGDGYADDPHYNWMIVQRCCKDPATARVQL